MWRVGLSGLTVVIHLQPGFGLGGEIPLNTLYERGRSGHRSKQSHSIAVAFSGFKVVGQTWPESFMPLLHRGTTAHENRLAVRGDERSTIFQFHLVLERELVRI